MIELLGQGFHAFYATRTRSKQLGCPLLHRFIETALAQLLAHAFNAHLVVLVHSDRPIGQSVTHAQLGRNACQYPAVIHQNPVVGHLQASKRFIEQ